MTYKTLILAAIASSLFWACNETAATAPAPEAAGRKISDKLRASCPELKPAARAAVDTEAKGISIEMNSTVIVSDSIFDSVGTFKNRIQAALGRSALKGNPTDSAFSLFVAWNGQDESGAACPAGRYFHFLRITDSTGNLVKADSSCGWIGRSAS